MKHLLKFIFSIIAFISLNGCSNDNSNNSNPNSSDCATTDPCRGASGCTYWYPTELSDEWKWIVPTLLGQTTDFRVRIGQDTVINGNTYITSSFVGGTLLTFFNDFFWIYGFRNSNGDLYEYDPDTNLSWLYLPNNPVVNQSWIRQGEQWKVVSLNFSLTTPTCSYNNLLKVKVTDTDGTYNYVCFGKGLGIVAQLDESSSITMYLGEVTIN
jgi:hypothetical protein